MKTRSKSLARRLVTYFAILLIATVALMGTLAYVMVRRNLFESVYMRLETALNLKSVTMEQWVANQRQEVAFLSGRETVQQWVATLAVRDPGSIAYGDAYRSLSQYFNATVLQKAGLREIFVLTEPDARVIISTDTTHEGTTHSEESYFVQGRSQLYVQGVYIDPLADLPVMTISSPIYREGELLGVLVAHLDLDRMHALILERSDLGARSEMYLMARPGLFIATSRADVGELDMLVEGIRNVLDGKDGQGVYKNYAGVSVVGGYRWLEDLNLALLVEIDERAAIVWPAQRTSLLLLVSGVLLGGLAAGIGYALVHRSVRPLQTLNMMAQRIASGDLEQTVPVLQEDEVGILAQSFNTMAQELRHLYVSLEQEVQIRTQALEQRTRQLEGAAKISSAVAMIYDIERLLNETVRLIVEHFHYDYAGIFILDERGDYAVLRAFATGDEHALLPQRYKQRVGEGVIGWVAQAGEVRIVAEAKEDEDFVINPDLPDIRSELAVPLRMRAGIMGVLDVQSTVPSALTEEDAAVLQTMAEQIALAIQNARLLQESERVVRELERRYSEQVSDAWQERLVRERLAYGYTGMLVEPLTPEDTEKVSVTPVSQAALVWDDDGNRQLVAPIRLRDQVLGTIVLRQSLGDEAWSEADVALLAATCDQIGLALDNARLLDESLARAGRERVTGEVSARIRDAATDVESVLRVTAYESALLLDASATVYVTGGEVGTAYIDACGYAYSNDALQQLEDLSNLSLDREVDTHHVVIPLVLRDQVVGAVALIREPEQPYWLPEEVQMVEAIVVQVGLALENAQLLVESQQRAARQQQLNEISRRFSQSLDIEALLRTAADELGGMPGVVEAAIHLNLPESPVSAPEDVSENQD